MITEDELGQAIVDAGFTWSDGYLRETKTVQELVLSIYPKLLCDHSGPGRCQC